ncbi:polysaccharide deacetylase family protein [Desulfotomaculum copahuensis]|uniref:Polysaccharide deacetylase n=1 Tax=Desulfotomaculum copahuensis TaxID=1838280 RepID=A0A1B7LI65_9FIRM|nr:polysaccharide deacetylase family protein [Desulfotomaculum copahuensis]OAT85884.1 polysaccharide deacetylase [Desulfotomaculum copahuensis]
MHVYVLNRQRVWRGVVLTGLGLMLLAWGYWFDHTLRRTVPASAMQPVYQGSAEQKEVALTVNVFWGEEYLPRMLAILKEENAPATFFIGGQWAEQFPRMVQEIAGQGNEIGNHGYSHPHPDQLSVAGNLNDIRRAEEILAKINGSRPQLYAPPYGEHGPAVLEASRDAGCRTILWSVDTIDWQKPSPEVISQRVLGKVHNGAIILMHPTAPTVEALPGLIKELKKQGYHLVTISTMLKHMEGEKQDR